VAAAVLMLSMMCAAQSMASPQAGGADAPPGDAAPGMQSPDQSAQSNRILFGRLCGIADAGLQSAIGLSRSPEGEWRVVTGGQRAGPRDNAAARVWREHTWMVDLHDAPGAAMHTGQMCFGASGQLMLLIDDYLDIPNCACLRSTMQTFDASGRMVRREQRFNSVQTGAEMAAPEAAKGFPEVFGFRRVEQLPFYTLLKK